MFIHIAFSVLVYWAVYVTLTRPQPPPKDSERVEVIGQDTFEISFVPNLVKILCLLGSLSEVIVTVAVSYPESPLSGLVLLYSPSSSAPSLSTARVLACVIAIAGAVLRQQSYAHLGRHFTFELAILSEHKLVKSGPYAYLRHPSYTAAILALFGALAWYTLPGSFVHQLVVHELGEKLAFQTGASLWLVATCAGTYILHKRLDKEDLMMKSEFGEEWEVWASRVPRRLLPGIY